MTKIELQEKVTLQEKKLKELEHLASAIEAKDKEINELVIKHDKRILEIEEKHKEEIEKLQKGNDNNLKRLEESFKAQIKSLENVLERRLKELNKLINIFGNTLKGFQGLLDNALDVNEYFINEVQSDG